MDFLDKLLPPIVDCPSLLKDPSTPLFTAGMILMLSPPLVSLVLSPLVAYISMWAGAVCLLMAILLLIRTGHE